jgi:hypothetical protein
MRKKITVLLAAVMMLLAIAPRLLPRGAGNSP